MNQVFNRTLIFDGSYALHRALAEPHNWEMINSKNKRTGGIFGVLRTILKEFKTYNYYPLVVFDGGLSKRRLEIYPNYKRAQEKALLLENKTEQKTEEELLDEEFRREYNTQRNDLIDILPAFGIPVINIKDWEGDDLIYILSKISRDSIVVSDDKDLIQLIYEPTEEDYRFCKIRRPLRDEFLDMNTLKEKGINVQEFIAHKAIVGDPSDNIPSACFQVGEKTAPALYKLYNESVKMVGGFPQNENDLTDKCKKIGISKRKAFLNFNETQFLTNVLLTDLSLVDKEISEENLQQLYNIIIEQFNTPNKQLIYEILAELEIKTFDIEQLYNRVASMKNMLKIEDKHAADIVKPINEVRQTGLF